LKRYNSCNSSENAFINSKASWIWYHDITDKESRKRLKNKDYMACSETDNKEGNSIGNTGKYNDNSNLNEYVEFLHEFYVSSTDVNVDNTILYISADSDYAVFLNGKFINCGQYDDFPDRKVYDVLDLSYNLQHGKNVLAIAVYYQGEGSFQYKKGNPGLIYLLKRGDKEICYSSSQTLCRMSAAWKNGKTPMITFQLGFTFQFDARKCDNWTEEGYVPQIAQFNSNCDNNCDSNYEDNNDFENKNCLLWNNALELADGKVCPRERLYRRPIKKLEFLNKINARIIAQGYLIRKGNCDDIPAQLMQTDFLSYCNSVDFFKQGVKMEGLTFYLDVNSEPEIDFDKINSDLNKISNYVNESMNENINENMNKINNGANKTRGAYIVLDLGREEAGLFSMDIQASEGTIIDIGYGEHLDDMRVRTWIGQRNFASRYICKKGRQNFTYYFKRFGCRYIQLHITNAKGLFKIYYAGLIPWEYSVSRRGHFKCNDSLHNKIYEVSERTLHLCMHEHYEDTPWREQALYAMDSRNQALCGYYCFGEYEMPRACFELLGMSLQNDGFLEICAPCNAPLTIPSFTMAWITEVWEYILYSGDLDYLNFAMPKVNYILDKHISTMQNGLLPVPVDKYYWNFYEWSQGMDGGNELYRIDPSRYNNKVIQYEAPYILFFCLALKAAANMAKLSNDEFMYKKYMDHFNIIKENFHSTFWDEQEEAYLTFYRKIAPDSMYEEITHRCDVNKDNDNVDKNDTVNHDDVDIFEKLRSDNKKIRHFAELTQALAICAGICSGDTASILRRKLSLKDNNMVKCTISHSIYKYEALLGEPEKYAKQVFEEIAEDWGYMLYNGATSFWETLQGSLDFYHAGSLSHGWSAVPIYLYGRYILGIEPISPGFREFRAEPLLSVFDRFSGKVPTPYGDIEIRWDKDSKGVSTSSNVPEIKYPNELHRIGD